MVPLQQMLEWCREADAQNIPISTIALHLDKKYCPAGWCAQKAGLPEADLNTPSKVTRILGEYSLKCPKCEKDSMGILEFFTHLTQTFWHEGHGLDWKGVIVALEGMLHQGVLSKEAS